VNQYLKLLKAVYNRARRHGWVTANPVTGVTFCQEHNARNRCLSAEEETRLLTAMPAWLRPMVTVAIPSVDTSNPAIGGQGKTGHKSGRSRPEVL
jgi:hypothetical protein